MNQRLVSCMSLSLATVAVLGTLSLAYGLVYPSGAHETKLPLAAAIVCGAVSARLAVAFGRRSHHHAASDSERFFAGLAWAAAAFFLFVIVFGFGLPALVVGVHD